jgi:hypothetical protein
MSCSAVRWVVGSAVKRPFNLPRGRDCHFGRTPGVDSVVDCSKVQSTLSGHYGSATTLCCKCTLGCLAAKMWATSSAVRWQN